MDQLSKMNEQIDDSEYTEALEMKKIGKTKPGLRKVKSVESGLGSISHEVPEHGFEFARWSKMTNVSSSNDSCGFESSGRSSSDSFIADKDQVNEEIRIYDISEELEKEFNELRINTDSNLEVDPEVKPRRPTPFYDDEDICQQPAKRFKATAILFNQVINEDEIFVEEGRDDDEDIDVFDSMKNGTTRRPTPYPFNEEDQIPERRSNTASCASMRKLSSQRLSDACSLLDETIAEVEDEILIFEKSLLLPSPAHKF